VAALEVSWGRQLLSVTTSVGISEYDPDMLNHQQWIQHADDALYQAKAQGRNRSIVLPGPSATDGSPDQQSQLIVG